MKLFRYWVFLLYLVGFITFLGNYGNITYGENYYQDYVPGEFIVKYKLPTSNNTKGKRISTFDVSTLEEEMQESLDDNQKLSVTDTVPNLNMAFISVEGNQDTQTIIDKLESNDNIEYVQPNYIYDTESVNSNDEYREHLWALDNQGQSIDNGSSITVGTPGEDIDWVRMWNTFSGSFSMGGTGSVVGVVDMGVNYNHNDLKNQMRSGDCVINGISIPCNHGYDFYHNNGDPMPQPADSHGTHVAGTIAAEMGNGSGIVGVNPKAKIISLMVGELGHMYSTSIIKAVNFATDNGVKILNGSYGGYANAYDTGEFEAYKRFNNSGGIFIFSAGNKGRDTDENLHYPSGYPLDNIISVTATTQTGGLKYNYGATTVDVGAPGVNIYSANVNSDYKAKHSINFREVSTGDLINHGYYVSPNIGRTQYNSLSFGKRCVSGDYLESHTMDVSILSGKSLLVAISINCGNSSGENIERMGFEINTGAGYREVLKFWTGLDSVNYNSLGSVNYHDLSYKFVIHKGSESNFSCGLRWILIPGGVAGPDDYYGFKNGTSMASPHVAGLASLAWMFRPDLSAQEIKQAILENGDPLPSLSGKTVSGKRINAYNTLAALDNYKPSKPQLISPDGTYFSSQTSPYQVDFEWHPSTDTGVGVSGYTIQLSKDSSFVSIMQTLDTSSTGINISITDTTGTYFWRVMATDFVGNTGEYSEFKTFVFDTTIPIITVTNPDSGWAKTKQISATATDNGTFTMYYIISGTSGCSSITSSYNNYNVGDTINLTESNVGKYICFKTVDNAGNVSFNASEKIENIDSTPPTLISKTTFDSNWYTGDKTSVFTYTDTGAGINGASTTQCSISTEGTASICNVSNTNICDNAGNCNTTEQTSNSIKLDKTAPECGTWSYSPSLTSGTKGPVTATLTGATDGLAGIQSSTGECLIYNVNGTCDVTIKDNAGNSTVCTSNPATNIDEFPPILSIEYSATGVCMGSNVTVFVHASDQISGVPADGYSWNSENDWGTATGLVLSKNGSGIVYVRDGVGNYTGIRYNVTWIDNDAPVLTPNNVTGFECSFITGSVSVSDGGCGDFSISYSWSGFGTGTASSFYPYRLMGVGTYAGVVSATDGIGNQSSGINVVYTWIDSLPTLVSGDFHYSTTIKSTQQNIGNIITMLGAKDGNCGDGTGYIQATSASCDFGSGKVGSGEIINYNELVLYSPTNSNGSGKCVITIKDDEGNTITGSISYLYDTVPAPAPSGGGSSGGGGGGGGGGSSSKNVDAKIDDVKGLIHEEDQNLVKENEETTIDSTYPAITPNIVNPQDYLLTTNLNNGYSLEFNNAFLFARKNGITTMKDIQSANMYGGLDRISMAKMLSNYAVNILGKMPDTSKQIQFVDVTDSLNAQYGNGVILSYQLGIMGLNMPNNKFRPFDSVTRAEFSTALSRMLYSTIDGNPYYIPHLQKLRREGIITNADPLMKELRGYVMIMLMRSVVK